MADHIIVFFYSFAVFLSICSICLILVISRRRDERLVKELLLFICCFFIWGVLNLVAYYKMHVIASVSILPYYTVLLNFSYILAIFFWVKYVCGDSLKNEKIWYAIFKVICVISIILWTMDCLFFMDRYYNIINAAGNALATLFECFLAVPMIALLMKGIIRQHSEGRDRTFFLKGACSCCVVALYAGVSIKDIGTSFMQFNLYTHASTPWAIAPVFCFLINFMILVYLIAEVYGFVRSFNERDERNEMVMITLEELCNDFNITPRELDVLRLIYQGKDNQEISDELFISINTTKKHVNSIFRKLEVDSRAELLSKIYMKMDNGTQG